MEAAQTFLKPSSGSHRQC